MSTTKISIRFFDDREVRAVWDEDLSKWWFSALDIIAVLTDQNDYSKNRNYWKYLKAKFKKENSQVVSATTQLKLRVNLPHLRHLRETRPTPNFLQLNPRKSAPSALTAAEAPVFGSILSNSA
jgi:prophage antirepressor-like protein